MAAHSSHCGGACMLKLHVKDGVITRIETDTDEYGEPQYRACARGRAYRQRVYAPDRILHPLKRVGERGEGKFEQISWDEALDTVAGEIKRIRDTYGSEAIIFKPSGGDVTWLHGGYVSHARMLRLSGGYSNVWGFHSFEGAVFSQIATYGSNGTASTRDNLLHSKMIIIWGWNPAESIHLTGTDWYLAQAREKGIKIVSIDPRYTRSTALFAPDNWIPIRPGTDTAMMVAMAYVMIDENLQDQKFLDTYTIGFDKFKDYVMGIEDGTPKTPQWAKTITGVPAATIENLAREFAGTKPAAMMTGISPGRTAFGEQYHRAGATLAAMTGNVGVHGGDAGISGFTGTGVMGRDALGAFPFMKLGPALPLPFNPVEDNAPRRKNAFPNWGTFTQFRAGHINQTKVGDAILRGKAGGYPADYKMLYTVTCSWPNQYQNINKLVNALKSKSLEFVLVYEQFMTPAAKFADIILPTSTSVERNDFSTGTAMGYYTFMNKCIDSVGESMSHLEICTALAERLGVKEEFTEGKTEDEWLKQLVDGIPQVTDYEAFKKAGSYKIQHEEPYIAFQKQIEDPKNNPFLTPSGKIEIYCQRIADMNIPDLPAIPKYIETWESINDPLAKKYPLQLVTSHNWRRAHTQYDNLPWLRELETHRLGMSPVDAQARGIKTGDMVKVFNDRGITVMPANLVETLMPGVVDMPQGTWYDPDENGIDRGGSCNVLTRDEHSPGGAYITNTCLVQVEKEKP